jgi:hypothetical protein
VAKVVAAARNSGVESLNLLVEPEIVDAPEEDAEKAAKAPATPGKARTDTVPAGGK